MGSITKVATGSLLKAISTISVGGASTDVSLLNKEVTQVLIKDALVSNGAKVQALSRVCVSHQGITVPITTNVTLASLCAGGVLPTGAVTCELQAQKGVVNYRLDGSTVTPTSGAQIGIGETYLIDTTLASVNLVADTTATSAVACSAKFFDRV